MTVYELTQEQIDELKVRYVFDHNPNPSWSDIAYAENIPNEVVFEEYGGIHFVEEDFSCEKEDVATWADKWYGDCLEHDIPVSPSDVRDIIRELVELRTKQREEQTC